MSAIMNIVIKILIFIINEKKNVTDNSQENQNNKITLL